MLSQRNPYRSHIEKESGVQGGNVVQGLAQRLRIEGLQIALPRIEFAFPVLSDQTAALVNQSQQEVFNNFCILSHELGYELGNRALLVLIGAECSDQSLRAASYCLLHLLIT